MRKTILFTRPCYDLPTQYLSHISGKTAERLKYVNEQLILDLADKSISRARFEKAMRKFAPRLAILNGHGDRNAVYGSCKEAILDSGNVNLLSSKIVYAVACDSLEGLGELAISKGKAACYMGYGANFMIIIDPARSTVPGKDKNLKPFIQVYAAAVLSLAAGLSVAESIDRTKEKIKDLIREYGVYGIKDKYGDAPLIRWALYWDLFFLNAHGDLNCRL